MEAGNQQKIELFGKSGHEEFRNNYEENRADVIKDVKMERVSGVI